MPSPKPIQDAEDEAKAFYDLGRYAQDIIHSGCGHSCHPMELLGHRAEELGLVTPDNHIPNAWRKKLWGT